MASTASFFFAGFATAAAIGAGFAGAFMEADSAARQRQPPAFARGERATVHQVTTVAIPATPSTSGRAFAPGPAAVPLQQPGGLAPPPTTAQDAGENSKSEQAGAQPEPKKQKKFVRKRFTDRGQAAAGNNDNSQFSFGREQSRGYRRGGFFNGLLGNYELRR